MCGSGKAPILQNTDYCLSTIQHVFIMWGKLKITTLTPHLVRVGLSGKIVSILLQLLMVQQLMASPALGAKCD